jgi:hypothetical protein
MKKTTCTVLIVAIIGACVLALASVSVGIDGYVIVSAIGVCAAAVGAVGGYFARRNGK